MVGYYETLELVFEKFKDIDITESNIRHLHSLLLKHSKKDKHHKGSYKKITNKVVATYPTGLQKNYF